VRAILAWQKASGIDSGPLFRRVQVRRYKACAAIKGRKIGSLSGREAWDLRKTLSRPAVPARVEYDVGEGALHPGSIGPIYRSIISRAFDWGALPDLTADDLARLLKGISYREFLGAACICKFLSQILIPPDQRLAQQGLDNTRPIEALTQSRHVRNLQKCSARLISLSPP
jgi:hypothetical protein